MPLHGRDQALKLVRGFMERPKEGHTPRSRRSPVVVFVGPRGSGKTALLDELARRLDQQVPYARVDFERMDGAAPHEVLIALAFELNRQCGTYGRLAFPRFVVGELAIDQELDVGDRAVARAQIERALEEYRSVDRLREFFRRLVPDVLSGMAATKGVPGVQVAGEYLPDLLLDGITSRRLGRRVVLGKGQSWYGELDRWPTDGSVDGLVELNLRARRVDVQENRSEVDEVLFEAFLADLRDDYGANRRAGKHSLNCVVLLDNVDTTDGLDFLAELVRVRRQRTAEEDTWVDPLTVVATSRGILPTRVLGTGAPIATLAVAGIADYATRSDDRLGRWWYPVRLRDLTEPEILTMVKALRLREGTNRRIAAAVYQFTRGHPGATRLILDTVAEQPGDVDDLRLVLGRPEPGGPDGTTVEDGLRRRLLRAFPDDLIDDLVTCSAARDMNQAARLAAHSGLLECSREDLKTIFQPGLWDSPEEGQPAVLQPVLRRLLLQTLAARKPDDPAGWRQVHGWLRARAVEESDLAHALHSALAVGDVEYVVAELTDQLPRIDVAEWLALLRAVVTAPNAFDDMRTPMQRLPRRTAPMTMLSTALWLSADPLGNGQRKALHTSIAASYDAIAPLSLNGLAVLQAAAEWHRRESRLWE